MIETTVERSEQRLVAYEFGINYVTNAEGIAKGLRNVADYIEQRGIDAWEIESLELKCKNGWWCIDLVIDASADARHSVAEIGSEATEP